MDTASIYEQRTPHDSVIDASAEFNQTNEHDHREGATCWCGINGVVEQAIGRSAGSLPTQTPTAAYRERVYIAGKITDLDPPVARENFAAAERWMIHAGYEPINPMAKVSEQSDMTWVEYMIEDIPLLLSCEAIYLLANWQDSKGARLEKYIAEQLGLKIIYADMATALNGSDAIEENRVLRERIAGFERMCQTSPRTSTGSLTRPKR
jgi:hypothetical protein